MRINLLMAEFVEEGELAEESERRLLWFLNCLRRHVLSLGLKRKSRDITLENYVKSAYADADDIASDSGR